MEGTNPLTMTEWIRPYIWPWKEPILSPCQNGSRTHHFPLEGTSIWRIVSFSLKYSNFTLAISSIESHQGWLHPRITWEIFQDWLHLRTTYKTVYVWETYELHQDFMLKQPVSLAMLELISPSFERYRSRSQIGASLLLFASYKNASQISQIK